MIYIIYSFLTIILIIITYKNYFMSNQVVTIGYLKDFVNGKLTVSTDMPDTYCPTYGELTSGALVFNYSSASNPKDTKNGDYCTDPQKLDPNLTIGGRYFYV